MGVVKLPTINVKEAKKQVMSGLSVTVKTANGIADDLQVRCGEEWSVFDLKAHLSQHHPVQPPVRRQKIIYGGRLLEDEVPLGSLGDRRNSLVVHLVISPVFMRTPSLSNPESSTTAQERPLHQPTPPPPSLQRANDEMDQTIPPNPWLRFRPPHPPPQMQGNSFPMPMAWPNPYLMSPYNVAMATQMAQWYQMFNTGGASPPGPAQPPVAAADEANTEGLLPDEPGEGGNGQDELPDDMAMNAGGGMLMGGVRRHRDVVDYLYMLMMLVFMSTIGYLTGSLRQFIIFFVGVTVILLNQAGWFTLRREGVNQQPQQQLEREEQRPPGRDERREAEGNEAERHAEGDGEEELEEEERAVLDNGGPQAQRPGLLATVFVFVTSFFSSLLPQQLPELQEN